LIVADIRLYPRVVIRELAVNALSHHDDHLIDAAIRITLVCDRIPWASPHGLPPGVTVENILLQQKSRNRNISRVLYEASYVEAFGQGLDIVVNVLRDEGMEEARFEDFGAACIVTVFGRKLESLHVGLYAYLPESQQRIMNERRDHDEAPPMELIERFASERSRRLAMSPSSRTAITRRD
jgi:predicted HTH transcriptional regulator